MFHTIVKQIALLVGHTLINFFLCMLLCSLFKLPGGEYGMAPLLLLVLSLVMFGVYIVWTIFYFIVKEKILNTNRIIIYYSIGHLIILILGGIMEITDIIYWIFIISSIISLVVIYFLNKILNEKNFDKMIS